MSLPSLKKNIPNLKVAIVDGYLDEPSCLGVPPYISPYIRYAYGAATSAGVQDDHISYILIDQIRQNWDHHFEILNEFDVVLIVAGSTVPGRYLRGKPASLKELFHLSQQLTHPFVLLGGPVLQILTPSVCKKWEWPQVIDTFTAEIPAVSLYELIAKQSLSQRELLPHLNAWAVSGAQITAKHPYFPMIVCELETFRGCLRPSHCAFCSERFKQISYCRNPQDVVVEVAALYEQGNRYFRLGCQTDLLAYGGCYKAGILHPNPFYLKELYQGIRDVAPRLKVLHMDNINPASIAQNPEKSRALLSTICTYNTPGDVAAFGLESADPLVLQANNINTNPNQVDTAISIMNDVGAVRQKGVPQLLPGLNFLHGLQGETPLTMRKNYDFLQGILDRGLLLRRINIRKVLETGEYKTHHLHAHKFQMYKDKINKEINLPMLQKVFPIGTVLADVLIEKHEGELSFGRQLGTYPILVGIAGRYPLNTMMGAVTVDHGYRSITALPHPFNLNEASLHQLESLPGVGKKRARRIFLSQPIKSLSHLHEVLDKGYDVARIKDWIAF